MCRPSPRSPTKPRVRLAGVTVGSGVMIEDKGEVRGGEFK